MELFIFYSLGAKEIIFYEWKSIFQIIEEQINFNFDAKEFNFTKNCAFNILSQQVFSKFLHKKLFIYIKFQGLWRIFMFCLGFQCKLLLIF